MHRNGKLAVCSATRPLSFRLHLQRLQVIVSSSYPMSLSPRSWQTIIAAANLHHRRRRRYCHKARATTTDRHRKWQPFVCKKQRGESGGANRTDDWRDYVAGAKFILCHRLGRYGLWTHRLISPRVMLVFSLSLSCCYLLAYN